MKKIFFLLITFSAFEKLAVCQNSFGLKAGTNLANQHLSFNPSSANTIQPTSFLGYRFGVFYKVKANKKWSISSEINFSLIGSRELFQTLDSTQISGTVTNRYSDKIGYLEVPLGVQYNISNFYLGLGPSIAIKLFSRMSNVGNTPYYRTFDIAGNALAGYKITNNLDVNLGYSYGLVNILKDQNKYGGARYATMKNRFLNLSILYSLK